MCNYNNDCGDNSDEFGCRKCSLPNILHEKEDVQMKHARVAIGESKTKHARVAIGGIKD